MLYSSRTEISSIDTFKENLFIWRCWCGNFMQYLGILQKIPSALAQGVAFSPSLKHPACEWSLAPAGSLHWSLTLMFASSVVWPEIAARKPHSVKIVRQNKLSKCMSVNYHRPQAGNDWVTGSFSSLCAAQNKFPNLPQKPQVLRNYKTPIQTLSALSAGTFCFKGYFKQQKFTRQFHVHLIPT